MKVIVLSGGDSPEREVSLRSGKAVLDALRKAGFETENYDPADGLIFLNGISDGIIFPILHGAGGEDGSIQIELEKRHLRFLGADSEASRICFDKSLTRKRLQAHDIPMAEGTVVTKETYEAHPLTKKPHILKVARGGSSIGTLFVRDPRASDAEKVDEIFDLDDLAILEELVEGIEITVPILDTEALPVIEIRPPSDGEFDYENKYNGQTAELCPPESVGQRIQTAAQRLAEQVHQVTGCRHLSRVDIIVRPDGRMVVLEINTLPGMTDQSLYPKSALAAGLDFPALMTRFVDLVKEEA